MGIWLDRAIEPHGIVFDKEGQIWNDYLVPL